MFSIRSNPHINPIPEDILSKTKLLEILNKDALVGIKTDKERRTNEELREFLLRYLGRKCESGS